MLLYISSFRRKNITKMNFYQVEYTELIHAEWILTSATVNTPKKKGVKITISPDAHRISMIDDIKYGVGIARKGWLTKGNVLNCFSVDEVLGFAGKAVGLTVLCMFQMLGLSTKFSK